MAASAFIDDDYNETGRIAAVEGLHPEVRFSYRPMTAQEWMRCLSECEGKTLIESREVQAKWLTKKLISWDIRDRSGNPVPATVEKSLKLHAPVFHRLFNIVAGQEKTDAVPLDESAKN